MLATLKNIGFAVLCFALGLSLFYSIYQKPANQRDVASEGRKVLHLSVMTPEEIQQQLRSKIKVHPTTNGEKTISFSGFSAALCNTYSAVEVEFAAEGMSVGGEAPAMTISSPCRASATDSSQMAAIIFPVGKITGEKPRNAEYSYNGYVSTVAFRNSGDEWPKTWVLKRVEFRNAGDGENKSASFNRAPASAEERPIVLEF